MHSAATLGSLRDPGTPRKAVLSHRKRLLFSRLIKLLNLGSIAPAPETQTIYQPTKGRCFFAMRESYLSVSQNQVKPTDTVSAGETPVYKSSVYMGEFTGAYYKDRILFWLTERLGFTGLTDSTVKSQTNPVKKSKVK